MTTMTSVLQKAPLEGNHVQLSKLKHLFGIVIILFQFFFFSSLKLVLRVCCQYLASNFSFFSFVKVIVHCRVLLGRVARSILKSQALNWRNTDPFCSTVILYVTMLSSSIFLLLKHLLFLYINYFFRQSLRCFYVFVFLHFVQ